MVTLNAGLIGNQSASSTFDGKYREDPPAPLICATLYLTFFLLASSIGMTIFPGQSGRDPCFHILRSSAFISLMLSLSSFRSGNSSTFITSGGLSRMMTSPGAAPSSLRSKLSKQSGSPNEMEWYLIGVVVVVVVRGWFLVSGFGCLVLGLGQQKN